MEPVSTTGGDAVCGRLCERILNANKAVVFLETSRSDELVEQVRLRVRYTGESMYAWRRSEGLRSLRDARTRIPGCERANDAIRHVRESRHFGVYFLSGLSGSLTTSQLALLQSLDFIGASILKRVVLLSECPQLAQSLGSIAVVLRDPIANTHPGRLRDGQWVP